MTDKSGNLQYTPFPPCAETSHPLALPFARSADINCTITLTDPLFHLLEYYLHADAPLFCRLPAGRPPGPEDHRARSVVEGSAGSGGYVPFVLALAGALDKSHLHVRPVLNVAVHHAPAVKSGGGLVRAAGAYSAAGGDEEGRKVIIGDDVPLTLRVRWYAADGLPSSEEEGGGFWSWAGWWRFGWMAAVGYAVCYIQLRVLRRRGGKDILPTMATRLTYGQAMAQGFGKRE